MRDNPIQTGIATFDEAVTFRGGQLVLVAARPMHGKTRFVEQIAEHMDNAVCHDVRKVAVFNLEKGRVGCRSMKEICRDMIDIADECLAFVIDSYELLLPNPGERFVDEDQVMREAKACALAVGMPVFMTCQVGREPEFRADDPTPRLREIAGSGAMEAAADIVIFPFRYDIYSDETSSRAELIIAKNRFGKTQSIPVFWDFEKVKFCDLSLLKEPDGGYFGDENLEGY